MNRKTTFPGAGEELEMQLQMIEWTLERIHKELWEMDGQGELNVDNMAAIVSHLSASLHYAKRAKWRSVEHLQEDADLMS